MGPSVLVIKRGPQGAYLVTERGLFIAPAFPVSRVVDPTGAGDSFSGAMMGYLSEARVDRSWAVERTAEWDQILRRAVLAGCVMASFTVEDFGFNRLKSLEIKDLVARQKQLLNMIALDPS
ncbi:unnamed protein product [Sphagnum jensenii]|uniref:Carbohydrate kinase PfkB domain-containing protein n=1 Tax=Sphagnum jensenii TaxID=128206 RepID=A0ABP0VEN8_9BRYO